MNKYGIKARQIIEKTLREYKRGELHSGKSGFKVKSRKQALAIGIQKVRTMHMKVPNGGHH